MSSKGELSLAKLLATLTTVVHDDTYVFVTLLETEALPPLSEVQLFFREAEGTTIVTTRDLAISRGYQYEYECKKITLNVHSSLEAVGFMAAVATRLAAHGMSVNPVSGFYHDHLFVPIGREGDTVVILEELAKESSIP